MKYQSIQAIGTEVTALNQNRWSEENCGPNLMYKGRWPFAALLRARAAIQYKEWRWWSL